MSHGLSPLSYFQVRTAQLSHSASAYGYVSVSVQLANIYLHVVISAVSATQLVPESSAEHHMNRRLAPWYFPTNGVTAARNFESFWSAALTASDPKPDIANRSSYVAATDQINSYVLNYTDNSGMTCAVVRPLSIDPGLEWSGTGYGVSTQCTPTIRSECRFFSQSGVSSLNCTIQTPPGSIVGGLTSLPHKTWTDNWHEYLAESRSLTDSPATLIAKDGYNLSHQTNTTLHDPDAVLYNPWHSMAKINVLAEDSELPSTFLNSPYLLRGTGDSNKSAFLLSCNTTGERSLLLYMPVLILQCMTPAIRS